METVKRMVGKKKSEEGGTPSAPAGAAAQAGAALPTQAPAPVATGPPALGRISTEYGEIEGEPFKTGMKRGPLSPRAQAVRDRLGKLMEEDLSVQ